MPHRDSTLSERGGCVREETDGASLGAGGNEVASELWTERVFSRCGTFDESYIASESQ